MSTHSIRICNTDHTSKAVSSAGSLLFAKANLVSAGDDSKNDAQRVRVLPTICPTVADLSGRFAYSGSVFASS